jgi:hypothetical protein
MTARPPGGTDNFATWDSVFAGVRRDTDRDSVIDDSRGETTAVNAMPLSTV